MRCKGTFPAFAFPGNPNPPPPTTSTCVKSVSILGPTADNITAGLNVNSTGSPEMYIWVTFEVLCGTSRMGMMVQGYCQERVRRPTEVPPYDSGWVGPTPSFFLTYAGIQDYKRVVTMVPSPNWDALPDGTVIDDYFQQNRLVIQNCNGASEYFYFADRHFKLIKTGAQSWKLTEVP